MEEIETIYEYNESKKYLTLHFSKISKTKNYPLSPERVQFLSDFFIKKYIPKEKYYARCYFLNCGSLDITSSSWVEADNASQMVSSTGPRAHMGVAKSCKATTDLANKRMKRNSQHFAKSMLSTIPDIQKKYDWASELKGLHESTMMEAIDMYERVPEYHVYRANETSYYV